MTTKFPRAITCAALAAVMASSGLFIQAQTPASGSSARNIPTAQEGIDNQILKLINKSEEHFKQGLLNLQNRNQDGARDDFDKAVDVILESGYDVRTNERLQRYYWDLVERIYRLRDSKTAQQIAANYGVSDAGGLEELSQEYEPGNLEELAKLEFTQEEQKVTVEETQQLVQAVQTVNTSSGTSIITDVNPLIQQFINYYQGRGRQTMVNGLNQSGQYINMAKRIFREEGVPEDIAWLGQVESAWKVRARSWASAVGLWQFIPGTGLRYGLRQTAWIDERSSYEKATRASARYLKFLADRYNGNWELAMGAYNTGEGNVDRAIGRAGVASFWAIYPFIPQETRNYVPNILAVILIAKNPDRYGFGNIPRMPPLQYARVEVPGSVSFQLVAAATGVDVDAIRYLNPEIKRDRTPPGENYTLNVPLGREKQFVAVLSRIPVSARDNVASVAYTTPGETLEQFANRNAMSLDALRQYNVGVGADQQPGIVVVPRSGVSLTRMQRPTSNGAPVAAATFRQETVTSDMSLETYAKQRGYDLQELMGLNGFPAGAILKKGTPVKVPNNTPRKSR
jgi:membrane-bound lytic murein transglycosylase D